MEKIMQISSVELQIWKSNPPILEISCMGTATTPGWTNPQLTPYYYIMPPRDGIYEFDFVAEPPKGPVQQVLSPIKARFVWPSFPENLKGVRVYAKNNDIVEMLSEETNEISLDVKQTEASEGEQMGKMADHIGLAELENRSFVFNAVVLSHEPKTLYLNGLVLTYRENDEIIIKVAEPQGINPAILICNLTVRRGTGFKNPQLKAFTHKEVNANYQQVTIIYKNESETVDVQTITVPPYILEVMETKKHEAHLMN